MSYFWVTAYEIFQTSFSCFIFWSFYPVGILHMLLLDKGERKLSSYWTCIYYSWSSVLILKVKTVRERAVAGAAQSSAPGKAKVEHSWQDLDAVSEADRWSEYILLCWKCIGFKSLLTFWRGYINLTFCSLNKII